MHLGRVRLGQHGVLDEMAGEAQVSLGLQFPGPGHEHHPLNPPTPPRRLPVPLTFALVSTAADRVEADLLAVPVFAPGELGPGGTVNVKKKGTIFNVTRTVQS